eukprot:353578-Chlamydomonas_euryale.AAC.14
MHVSRTRKSEVYTRGGVHAMNHQKTVVPSTAYSDSERTQSTRSAALLGVGHLAALWSLTHAYTVAKVEIMYKKLYSTVQLLAVLAVYLTDPRSTMQETPAYLFLTRILVLLLASPSCDNGRQRDCRREADGRQCLHSTAQVLMREAADGRGSAGRVQRQRRGSAGAERKGIAAVAQGQHRGRIAHRQSRGAAEAAQQIGSPEAAQPSMSA